MQTIVTMRYDGDMHCETIDPKGRAIAIDSMANKGKPGYQYNPLDLLALAHGSCTAIMLAKAAESIGVDVRGMRVEVQQEYDVGPPMRLKTVNIRYLLPRLVASEEEAALRAGAGLCPVHTALRSDVQVNFEIASLYADGLVGAPPQ